MKIKKQKPISLRMAAYTRLHLNKDFVTNSHFALRSSLFAVLGFDGENSADMISYEVQGNGRLGLGSLSALNSQKVERVFQMADDAQYETELAHLRSSDNVTVKIAGPKAAQHIAPKYLPLFERLAAIPGGEWQINAQDSMRALRFVLNGKTEALLMPVKAASESERITLKQ